MEITPAELLELFRLWSGGKEPVVVKRREEEKKPRNSKVGTNSNQARKEDAYQSILLEIMRNYGESRPFAYSNALKIALDRLDYRATTTRQALLYGIRRGAVVKVSQGWYSLVPRDPQQQYASIENRDNDDALIEIVSKDAAAIKTVFKVMGKLRNYVTLFVNQSSGLSARFMDSEQTGMLDVQIKREYFTRYLCKSNAKLTVELDDVVRVLDSASKHSHFQMLLPKDQPAENGFYKIADHKLTFNRCVLSEKEGFNHAIPLPNSSSNDDGGDAHQIIIAKDILIEILKNAKAGSNRLLVVLEGDKLTFSSGITTNQYSKTLHSNGRDLTINKPIDQRIQATFSIDRILPVILALGKQIEVLEIRIRKTGLLSLSIPMHESLITLQYFLAPIREKEKDPKAQLPQSPP